MGINPFRPEENTDLNDTVREVMGLQELTPASGSGRWTYTWPPAGNRLAAAREDDRQRDKLRAKIKKQKGKLSAADRKAAKELGIKETHKPGHEEPDEEGDVLVNGSDKRKEDDKKKKKKKNGDERVVDKDANDNGVDEVFSSMKSEGLKFTDADREKGIKDADTRPGVTDKDRKKTKKTLEDRFERIKKSRKTESFSAYNRIDEKKSASETEITDNLDIEGKGKKTKDNDDAADVASKEGKKKKKEPVEVNPKLEETLDDVVRSVIEGYIPEGQMKSLAFDLKDLNDKEFQAKWKMSKATARKKLGGDLAEGRGRADTGDTDDGNTNFQMQMRKSQSLRGQFLVTFRDGKKEKVSMDDAMIAQAKLRALKPIFRQKLQAKMSKSFDEFKKALKEEVDIEQLEETTNVTVKFEDDKKDKAFNKIARKFDAKNISADGLNQTFNLKSKHLKGFMAAMKMGKFSAAIDESLDISEEKKGHKGIISKDGKPVFRGTPAEIKKQMKAWKKKHDKIGIGMERWHQAHLKADLSKLDTSQLEKALGLLKVGEPKKPKSKLMRDSAANIRAELKKRGVKAEGYDLDEGKNNEVKVPVEKFPKHGEMAHPSEPMKEKFEKWTTSVDDGHTHDFGRFDDRTTEAHGHYHQVKWDGFGKDRTVKILSGGGGHTHTPKPLKEAAAGNEVGPETPTTTAVKETNEYMSLEHQIKHVMSNNR